MRIDLLTEVLQFALQVEAFEEEQPLSHHLLPAPSHDAKVHSHHQGRNDQFRQYGGGQRAVFLARLEVLAGRWAVVFAVAVFDVDWSVIVERLLVIVERLLSILFPRSKPRRWRFVLEWLVFVEGGER